jgi:hypothetical protein
MSDVQAATLRAVTARLRFGSDVGQAHVWLCETYYKLSGRRWS